MSFSNEVKSEIIANKPLRLRYKDAQAYGLFLCARAFSPEAVALQSENPEVAELYAWFLRSFLGRGADIRFRQKSLRGKRVDCVDLPQAEQRKQLLGHFANSGEGLNPALLMTPEDCHAFLAGAWLACGNITDPNKSYHLEFVVKDLALADMLAGLLNQHTRGVRRTIRRGAQVLYYKECAQIEDLLTLMGASKSSLAIIEVEIYKGVRNKANRVTNCETANIDKLVSASTAQIDDIRCILEIKGADWLPQNLRQVALLRLDNPDLSLRELAELCPTPISRSGMHHRLDKLSRLAAELRGTLEGESHV